MKLNLFKIPGGASYTAKFVISHFPANYQDLIYCEPFAGALNLFLQKEKCKVEWLNDINPEFWNLYDVIKNSFEAFYLFVKDLEYNEVTFQYWKNQTSKDFLFEAIKTYVLHNFSRSGLKKDFSWSERQRRGMPGEISGFLSKVAALPKISSKLQDAILTNKDYRDILKDGTKDHFFCCDSPYLHETRTTQKMYTHEMSEKDHEDLLDLAISSPSKILLMGYSNKLYDEKLIGWKRFVKNLPSNMGQTKKKTRKELVIWCNY